MQIKPDDKPQSIEETAGKLGAGFLHRMSHTSAVVVSAAILDKSLERVIMTKLPGLNKKISKGLFRDFGPLGSFSAKIDMAYALGITSDHIHGELGKMREIRNAFAHSIKILSLDVEPVRPLFDRLARPPGSKGSYAEVFVARTTAINDFLEEYLLRMGVADNLSEKRMVRTEDPKC